MTDFDLKYYVAPSQGRRVHAPQLPLDETAVARRALLR